jgi:coenzyme F420-0:L-glutamate ligase/coenzyme F420-1:gamma-L-glutamate ligase
MGIEIIGIEGLPIIGEGDDLAPLILEALKTQGSPLRDADVVVLSHVIVSRAEGRTVDLGSVEPSEIAVRYAEFTGKDPRLVEVVLGDSRAIRRMAPGVLITETWQGFVCANSGVDKSNVPGEDVVALLPEDPDGSARAFRTRIKELAGIDIAVTEMAIGQADEGIPAAIIRGYAYEPSESSTALELVRPRDRDLFL